MRIAPKGRSARIALPLQSHLDELLSGDTIKVCWLTELFRRKLEDQGVRLTPGALEEITEQIRKRFRNEDGLTWESPWHLDVEQGGEVELNFGQEDLLGFTKFVEEGVTSAVQDTVKECTPLMVDAVLRDVDHEHDARLRAMAAFRDRLSARWRKPFKLLSAQIALSGMYGEDMTKWLHGAQPEKKSAVVEAVTRLQARATQIAWEVETLLQNGFADGALSRWRTLHEVSIVALFIQQEGEETARRYLDHLDVDSRDMARFIQKAASNSGRVGSSGDELKKIEERVRALCGKHGPEFDGYYGWASKAIERLRNAGADRAKKMNPTFFDIEEAVDMDRLRPYYKLASGAVHAGPKGAFYKLGLLPGHSDVILAGPSNAGLSEAGRLTAWSLTMTCTALMMVEPMIDGLVWGSVISELGAQAGDAFVVAERRLHEDEAEHVRPHADPGPSNRPRLRVAEKPSARMRRRTMGT